MSSGTQRTRNRQTPAQKARADARQAEQTAADRLAARLEQESQGRPVPVLDETPYPEPDVTADPLADLRQDEDPTQPSEAPVAAPTFVPGALVTEDQQTLARHTLVAAWHAEPTTMGFLHRGEVCGCWYISGVTVGAILPVQANDDGTGEGGTE